MHPIPLRAAPTDLKKLLVGAMEALVHQAKQAEISLHVEAGDDIPIIQADAEKVAWAVTTLVGNALRFVKRGTRRMPGGSIVVRIAREEGVVAITVEDDGPGIPPEKLPWLFKRAPGTVHAAGLALMLVHEVVVAHGGTVDVKSATEGAERGTRVTLRLPIS